MNYSAIYTTALAAFFCITLVNEGCSPKEPPQSKIPNIVYILADDLGYKTNHT